MMLLTQSSIEGNRILQALIVSFVVSLVAGFAIQNGSRDRGRSAIFMAEFEYEYIPPNQGKLPSVQSNLPSVFDVTNTPAGMRGEAVRSAIRSGRCIAWDLGGTPLQQGWIKVEGKGTLDFLNNKLSQTFSSKGQQYTEGCLLNAKGRVVDRIGAAILSSDCAYMLTSPGHAGSTLFQRLDPLVFPMDRVSLRDCSDTAKIITLASTKLEHAQKAIETYVVPLLKIKTPWSFPVENKCAHFELASGALITILPTAILPETAVSGYTIVLEDNNDILGRTLWNNLIGEQSPNGPVEIGALEFDTLRIEGGMPLFGQELLGASKDPNAMTPAGPLELHWENLVDMNKGCYLGQEGVASMVKSPRGPPRLLYQVIFDYEGNVFNTESEGDRGDVENLTKLPEVGSDLFVLGSQNEINVGTLTSIAEPSGTGDPNMQGLALVRRADSILKAMRERGLEIDRSLGKEPFADDPLWNGGNVNVGSAIVQPPPMDPLDGVEVVVKDTFTVGVLRCIPSRRYRRGQNMFSDIGEVYDEVEPGEGEVAINRVQKKWSPEVEAALDALFDKQEQLKSTQGNALVSEGEENPISMYGSSDDDQTELDRAMEEVRQAKADADAAAAEAERKIAKMEMLQRRAADALKRRQEKKEDTAVTPKAAEAGEGDASADEAARKAAKVARLQKQAEEAIARRKAKQKEGGK